MCHTVTIEIYGIGSCGKNCSTFYIIMFKINFYDKCINILMMTIYQFPHFSFFVLRDYIVRLECTALYSAQTGRNSKRDGNTKLWCIRRGSPPNCTHKPHCRCIPQISKLFRATDICLSASHILRAAGIVIGYNYYGIGYDLVFLAPCWLMHLCDNALKTVQAT